MIRDTPGCGQPLDRSTTRTSSSASLIGTPTGLGQVSKNLFASPILPTQPEPPAAPPQQPPPSYPQQQPGYPPGYRSNRATHPAV